MNNTSLPDRKQRHGADEESSRLLDVLRHNQGFNPPEAWVCYAREHGFRQVRAETLDACPQCGARTYQRIGQYVYYSNLVRLCRCGACELVFSDVRIDPEVIRTHFEGAYKDEQYFTTRRHRIFAQIASLVDRFAPLGGTVLDVGGAKGHLMQIVRNRRPDLRITVNDISESACESASSTSGFRTICGDIKALADIRERFDVVVLSDVIYYEPDLSSLWRVLEDRVADDGTVVLRVPNKLLMIRIAGALSRWTWFAGRRAGPDRVPLFNPEHLFVFSSGFLDRQLQALGFSTRMVLPSEVLLSVTCGATFSGLWSLLARLAHRGSGGKLVCTPSMLVIGTRRSSGS